MSSLGLRPYGLPVGVSGNMQFGDMGKKRGERCVIALLWFGVACSSSYMSGTGEAGRALMVSNGFDFLVLSLGSGWPLGPRGHWERIPRYSCADCYDCCSTLSLSFFFVSEGGMENLMSAKSSRLPPDKKEMVHGKFMEDPAILLNQDSWAVMRHCS
jgi:hypothetical protein